MGGGLLAILGGKPEEGDESPKDMACKALFKAIKRDDYESFKTALDDYMSYRKDDASESDDESDDDESYKPKKKMSLFDD